MAATLKFNLTTKLLMPARNYSILSAFFRKTVMRQAAVGAFCLVDGFICSRCPCLAHDTLPNTEIGSCHELVPSIGRSITILDLRSW